MKFYVLDLDNHELEFFAEGAVEIDADDEADAAEKWTYEHDAFGDMEDGRKARCHVSHTRDPEDGETYEVRQNVEVSVTAKLVPRKKSP